MGPFDQSAVLKTGHGISPIFCTCWRVPPTSSPPPWGLSLAVLVSSPHPQHVPAQDLSMEVAFTPEGYPHPFRSRAPPLGSYLSSPPPTSLPPLGWPHKNSGTNRRPLHSCSAGRLTWFRFSLQDQSLHVFIFISYCNLFIFIPILIGIETGKAVLFHESCCVESPLSPPLCLQLLLFNNWHLSLLAELLLFCKVGVLW